MVKSYFDPFQDAAHQSRPALLKRKVHVLPYAKPDTEHRKWLIKNPDKNLSEVKDKKISGAIDLEKVKSLKLHSKIFACSKGSTRMALITTCAFSKFDAIEYGIIVDGETADSVFNAVNGLYEHLNGAAVDSSEITTLYGQLSQKGIVFNDPYYGVRELTDGLYNAIQDANSSLVIVVKEFTSQDFARHIINVMNDKTLSVRIFASKWPDSHVRKILTDKNCPKRPTIHEKSATKEIHGNLFLFDGSRALFCTAYPSDRALNLHPDSHRSRESGFWIEDRETLKSVAKQFNDEIFEGIVPKD